MLTIEYPTVTEMYNSNKSAAHLLQFVSIAIMDSLPCLFIYISFLTKCYVDIFYKSMFGGLSMGLNYT
jgi:hypothetical protein